jgi:hypothetical protein
MATFVGTILVIFSWHSTLQCHQKYQLTTTLVATTQQHCHLPEVATSNKSCCHVGTLLLNVKRLSDRRSSDDIMMMVVTVE